jgi:lipoyl(octanoyl) transferase
VRSRGLEPPRVAPQRPQRCASTNSATTARTKSALHFDNYHIANGFNRNKSIMTKTQKYSLFSEQTVEWLVSTGLTPYLEAVNFMERRVESIIKGEARELVWLVEHPPLYTAGTSAQAKDLITPHIFDVFTSGRGGQYTYHGPGQRVAYVMLNLNNRLRDVRAFVCALETMIIKTLGEFNVKGEIRDGRVGIWINRPDKVRYHPNIQREDKIAAIGIRLRKWVSFHGFALNVDPDLMHFNGIVPCGITEYGVTSLVDLGLPVTIEDVDIALLKAFENIFGPVFLPHFFMNNID